MSLDRFLTVAVVLFQLVICGSLQAAEDCNDYGAFNPYLGYNTIGPLADGSYAWDGYDVAAAGNIAWQLARTWVVVYDISDPRNPAVLGSIQLPNPYRYMTVADGHAFVTGQRGMVVIDLADSSNPLIVARIDHRDEFQRGAYRDGFLYVPTKRNHLNGISIYDVRNPAAPQFAEHYGMSLDIYSCEFNGDDLLVQERFRALWVLDASQNTRLIPTGRVDNGFYGRLAVHDGFAYVQSNRASWVIYDVRLSGPPAVVGEIPVYRSNWARAASGRLYIHDTDYGLLVFDLADPADPVLINRIPGGTTSSDLAVAGEFVVVSDWNGFLHVLNPEVPGIHPPSTFLPVPRAFEGLTGLPPVL